MLGKLNDIQKIEIDTIYTKYNVKTFLEEKEKEEYLKRDAEFRELDERKKRISKGKGSRYPINKASPFPKDILWY